MTYIISHIIHLIKRFLINVRNNGVRSTIHITYKYLLIQARRLYAKSPRLYILIHSILRKFVRRTHTDANPMKLLWVKPEKIKGCLIDGPSPTKLGHVSDGDWDKKTIPFSKISIYKSIEKRIIDKKSWESTKLYTELLNRPKDAVWAREYDTIESRDNRLKKIDNVINSINNEGYKSQIELYKLSPVTVKKQNNDGYHPYFNEISVAIGRNGELIWHHRGLHRLAIAKVLDINKVCILITTRHSNWQNIRNDIRNGNKSKYNKELLDHADLQDIINQPK